VFELRDRADLVFKAFRSAGRRRQADELVEWPALAEQTRPDLVARVRAATAWPIAVVIDRSRAYAPAGPVARVDGAAGSATPDDADAAGLILPRAPQRFSLRHRDGRMRLASLSYLSTDPRAPAAAYGVELPRSVSAERIGIVYALARVVEAFSEASPSVGHGDLSTKNVLWSLQNGPEIFVIDCDNSERFDGVGPQPVLPRRRAMTPNWEDPAVIPGGNPDLASDRYSLALIFLRVVGAAHFPIQGRQRRGETIIVEVEIPGAARRLRGLAPKAPVWDLCERGLSVRRPADRPTASEWVPALEGLLVDLGAEQISEAVRASQGGGGPVATLDPVTVGATDRGDRDVIARPVAAELRPTPLRAIVGAPRPAARLPVAPATSGSGPVSSGPAPAPPPMTLSFSGRPLLAHIRAAVRWWALLHRRMARSVSSPGRRSVGFRRLVVCAGLDVAVGAVALFLVAMMVVPFLGL
jgi:hypothetical protein